MKNKIKELTKQEGFTLIEMSIVLIIIALLLLFVIPNIGKVLDGATGTTDTAIVKTIDAQKELYKAEKNITTEPTLDELLSAEYISDEQKTAYDAATKRKQAE